MVGTCTITGGTIEGPSSLDSDVNYYIPIENFGIITINGGLIKGGTVWAMLNVGTCTITGGTIEDNVDYTPILNVSEGTLTIEGGLIETYIFNQRNVYNGWRNDRKCHRWSV